MTVTDAPSLQPIESGAALRGLRPLLAKENRAWWSGRRWLIVLLVVLVVVLGTLGMVLYVIPQMLPAESQGLSDDPVLNGLQAFFGIGSMVLAIAVIVLAQDSIIKELETGTAEWLLAKPVTRMAFILAKFTAHAVGILFVLVVLAVLAFGLLSRAGPLRPLYFAAATGIMVSHTLFYLALTIALGTVGRSRALVLTLALLVLLGGQLLANIRPLLNVTPWGLPSLATAVAASLPVPTATLLAPIAATILWSAAFLGFALWRFSRIEL